MIPTLLGCGVFLGGPFLPLAQAQAAAAPAAAAESAAPAFGPSLALRTDRVVADSTRPAYGWLTQTSVVNYTAKGALQLKVALSTWEGEPKAVKDLGTFPVYGGNLVTTPAPFTVDLRGVADGYYRYMVEVMDGDTKLATLTKHLVLVAGLEDKQADFNRRLEKISGKDHVKASVRYPFDLARVINLRKRVYGSANGNPEFGISPAGTQTNFDFTAGIKKSGELLAALEAGKDPLWRAGGDTTRHHYLKEADEILPYRLYVPSTWDGKTALPMVFIMHGNSRDQNFYLDRDEQVIPKTAEKYGYMLVSPLGYSPNGGYNYVPFNRERPAAGTALPAQQFGAPVAAAGGGGRGGRGGGGFGGVNGSTIPNAMRTQWSEADVLRVYELVKAEYPIDAKRTFLFGYSAGGQGAHYLGPKHANNWVAIAIGGSNAAAGEFYNFEGLKNIPIMVFSGSADGVLNATKAMAEGLTAKGVKATFKEITGANHDTAPGLATPAIFEFFKANERK